MNYKRELLRFRWPRGGDSKLLEGWLGKRFFRRDLGEIIVFFSVICYTLIFSYFTIIKYQSFDAYAWDLGIFNQSLWTTLHADKFFFSTVELFINPSGIFFGIHFSPILFLVLPVYAIYSSPESLLVFQSFVLALGAAPLYFFAKNALKQRTTALAFSLIYLLYPPLYGVNWFDFHVQAFLPVLFLSAMYFLSVEKWPQYFFSLFLSLMVAESVPVIVVFIGIYCSWLFRKQIVEAARSKTISDKRVFMPFLTIAFGLLWRLLAVWIQQSFFPINPAYSQLYKAIDNWSVLGIQDDPITLPLYVILNPGKALIALSYDLPLKLLYIFLLFGPLLFFSFRSLISAITLAWFVPILFSNYPPYYVIGTHFPAYVIAFIFLGAVDAFKSYEKLPKYLRLGSQTISLIVVSLIFAVFMAPFSPITGAFLNSTTAFSGYYPPLITKHDELLQTIVGQIPKDASVLTQNSIFPHVSGRVNAYVYPVQIYIARSPSDHMGEYLDGIISRSDFVLVDNTTDSSTSSAIVEKIDGAGYYGIYAVGDGICLYKRNYAGEPVFHVP